jgi:hypothetical protein
MRYAEGMTLFALIMVVFILIGCAASVPTASQDDERRATTYTSPPGKASVYVYRPFYHEGSALLWEVRIDDKYLGVVGPNTYLFDNIDPGSHIININVIRKYPKIILKDAMIKFNAEEGKLYFFKLNISHGWFEEQINVEHVDEREGRDKISSYKLSGYNIFDYYVLINKHEECAYTVFEGITKEKIDAVKMKIQTKKEVEIVRWDDFTHNLDKYVKSKIIKDDYPGSGVVEGIRDLLRKYSGAPFGLTWNGGIAITVNDYRHAETTYKKYQNNSAEYEHLKIQDLRLDPVNPKNHLGPLLGWQ